MKRVYVLFPLEFYMTIIEFNRTGIKTSHTYLNLHFATSIIIVFYIL